MLGDAVDRAGRGSGAQTDQRTLAGSAPGAGADGRAATGTDGRARRGAATGGREANSDRPSTLEISFCEIIP